MSLIKNKIIDILSLLLISQLFLVIGCYEPEHQKFEDISVSSPDSLQNFQSDRLNFKLSTDKDVDSIVSMYKKNPQDLISYFDHTPSSQYLQYDAEKSVKDNQDYIKSGKIHNNLTWSIFSKFDVSDKLKMGDFVGTIQAQKIKNNSFGLPENFANILKGKLVYNMARFLTSNAQGQGFGSEACKAYVVQIFKYTQADIIQSVSGAQNIASRKSVLACGFKQIGEFTVKGKSYYLLIKEKEDDS